MSRASATAFVFFVFGKPPDLCEAIACLERITGKKMNVAYSDGNRIGDHIWWISDVHKFQSHYPGYELQYNCRAILQEIHDRNQERWRESSRVALA